MSDDTSSTPPPQTMKAPTAPNRRPELCGPHAPERPYPIYLRGQVEKGFGRGSKDLGCPTANLPAKVVGPGSLLTRTGVYFGFARVLPQDQDDPLVTDSEDAEDADIFTRNDPAPNTFGTTYDDENEVILGASPIGGAAEGFIEAGLVQTNQNSGSQSDPAGSKRFDKETEVIKAELRSVPFAISPVPASSSAAEVLAGSSSSHVPSASTSSNSSGTGTSSAFSSNSRRRKTKRVPLMPEDSQVFPMVMSVGWNPFYQNTHKTAEVHILHDFASDFYGLEIRVVVLGYIRPEYNYDSMDALIADIEMDKRVTIDSLARPLYQDYSRDPFLGR